MSGCYITEQLINIFENSYLGSRFKSVYITFYFFLCLSTPKSQKGTKDFIYIMTMIVKL